MTVEWLSPWRIAVQAPLDHRTRQRVIARAKALYKSRPIENRLRGGAVEVAVTLAWMIAIFTVMPRLDNTRLEWVTFTTAPMLFGGVLTLNWLFTRLRATPFIYRALREAGYDVCLRCGYWLRGLGDDVTVCPECGAQREPMPAAPAEQRSDAGA
jgi:hypothetical protein